MDVSVVIIVLCAFVVAVVYRVQKLLANKQFEKEVQKIKQEISNQIDEFESAANDRVVNTQQLITKEFEDVLELTQFSFTCKCDNNIETNLFINSDNIVKCDACGNETFLKVAINPISITKPLNNNKIFDEVYEKYDELQSKYQQFRDDNDIQFIPTE